jgi:plasmid replication initiation protein
MRQRALYTGIAEINGKTDLKITTTTIERSKHRRVDALVFGIKSQAMPKR